MCLLKDVLIRLAQKKTEKEIEISMVLNWNKCNIEKQMWRGTKHVNDLNHNYHRR